MNKTNTTLAIPALSLTLAMAGCSGKDGKDGQVIIIDPTVPEVVTPTDSDPCSTETAQRPQTRYEVGTFANIEGQFHTGVAADADGACLSENGDLLIDGDQVFQCTSLDEQRQSFILVDQNPEQTTITQIFDSRASVTFDEFGNALDIPGSTSFDVSINEPNPASLAFEMGFRQTNSQFFCEGYFGQNTEQAVTASLSPGIR